MSDLNLDPPVANVPDRTATIEDQGGYVWHLTKTSDPDDGGSATRSFDGPDTMADGVRVEIGSLNGGSDSYRQYYKIRDPVVHFSDGTSDSYGSVSTQYAWETTFGSPKEVTQVDWTLYATGQVAYGMANSVEMVTKPHAPLLPSHDHEI